MKQTTSPTEPSVETLAQVVELEVGAAGETEVADCSIEEAGQD
jgi:hypothetical protein